MRKKLATMTAHRDRELTVTKMVTASRDWAVTWAVIEPWLSCDHTEDTMIELWPTTKPWLSCDWAVIIGPRSRDHHGRRELTVTIYFLMG